MLHDIGLHPMLMEAALSGLILLPVIQRFGYDQLCPY